MRSLTSGAGVIDVLMLKEQKVKSELITKKKKNMPEKSESMASSTVRRRKGVFPHLPCDKKGG